MPKDARIGDRTTGTCDIHGPNILGRVKTGSPSVETDEPPQARVDDIVLGDCGHEGIIITGSPTVEVEGKKKARLGDLFEGIYTGEIIEGSPTVETD